MRYKGHLYVDTINFLIEGNSHEDVCKKGMCTLNNIEFIQKNDHHISKYWTEHMSTIRDKIVAEWEKNNKFIDIYPEFIVLINLNRSIKI
jgi:hypothetical protein